MADEIDQAGEAGQVPPRVLADFGGRRKIFERRMRQNAITHRERRSDSDRRSGFDRRGALTQSDEDDIIEKRTEFPEITNE